MIAKKRRGSLALTVLISSFGFFCQISAMEVPGEDGKPIFAQVSATLRVPNGDDKPISVTGLSSAYGSGSDSVYSYEGSGNGEAASPEVGATLSQEEPSISVQIPVAQTEFSAQATRALTPPPAPTAASLVAPASDSAEVMSPIGEDWSDVRGAEPVAVTMPTSPKIEVSSTPAEVITTPTSPKTEASAPAVVSEKGKEPAQVDVEPSAPALSQESLYMPGEPGEFQFARPQVVSPAVQAAASTAARPPVGPHRTTPGTSPRISPRVHMQKAQEAGKKTAVGDSSHQASHTSRCKSKKCAKNRSRNSPLSGDEVKKCPKDGEKNVPLDGCCNAGFGTQACEFGQNFLSGLQSMNSVPSAGVGVVTAGICAHKIVDKLPIDEKLRHRLAHAFHGALSTAFLYNVYKWACSVNSQDRVNGWLLAASYFGADLAFEYGCDGMAKLRSHKIVSEDLLNNDAQDWDLKITKTPNYKKLILMSLLKKALVIGAWEACGN